ncbi:cysteine rich repeat-containing protein [Methylobacterium soli]
MRYLSLVIALALVPISAASAQPGGSPGTEEITPALRQACDSDYKRLCSGIQPGGGRILQCFRTHAKDLSEPCRNALSDHKS